ncbi:hypothetical protein R1flu_009328 [Riccia fluitans]|uniref:Uncharacterized protein n=1 Tax=Riccia fluitans TaxID=41844 RepID=A0ABD1Z1T1_9MARC
MDTRYVAASIILHKVNQLLQFLSHCFSFLHQRLQPKQQANKRIADKSIRLIASIMEARGIMEDEAIQHSTEGETSGRGKSPKVEEIHSRWKAGVQVPINMAIDDCWAVFADFANPQKFMTVCLECKIVEGEPNAVKSVRYVKGPNLDGSEGTMWANKRLLSIDHENHNLTYNIEENSVGVVNYEAYLQVHRGNNDTSFVTWSLEMDPLPGMTPPPNPLTKVVTDAFRVFIKNVESRYFAERKVEVQSPGSALMTSTA